MMYNIILINMTSFQKLQPFFFQTQNEMLEKLKKTTINMNVMCNFQKFFLSWKPKRLHWAPRRPFVLKQEQDVLHTKDFSTFPERLPVIIIWAVKGRTWHWILIKWLFSTVVTIAEGSLAPLAPWCPTYSDISYCTIWSHRPVVRRAGIRPLLGNSRFEQLVPPIWLIKLFIYFYKRKTQRLFSKVQSLLSPHSRTHCTSWVSPKATTLIPFPLINLSQWMWCCLFRRTFTKPVLLVLSNALMIGQFVRRAKRFLFKPGQYALPLSPEEINVTRNRKH